MSGQQRRVGNLLEQRDEALEGVNLFTQAHDDLVVPAELEHLERCGVGLIHRVVDLGEHQVEARRRQPVLRRELPLPEAVPGLELGVELLGRHLEVIERSLLQVKELLVPLVGAHLSGGCVQRRLDSGELLHDQRGVRVGLHENALVQRGLNLEQLLLQVRRVVLERLHHRRRLGFDEFLRLVDVTLKFGHGLVEVVQLGAVHRGYAHVVVDQHAVHVLDNLVLVVVLLAAPLVRLGVVHQGHESRQVIRPRLHRLDALGEGVAHARRLLPRGNEEQRLHGLEHGRDRGVQVASESLGVDVYDAHRAAQPHLVEVADPVPLDPHVRPERGQILGFLLVLLLVPGQAELVHDAKILELLGVLDALLERRFHKPRKLSPGVGVVGVGREHLHRGLGALEALVVLQPLEQGREGPHEHQAGHRADCLHELIDDCVVDAPHDTLGVGGERGEFVRELHGGAEHALTLGVRVAHDVKQAVHGVLHHRHERLGQHQVGESHQVGQHLRLLHDSLVPPRALLPLPLHRHQTLRLAHHRVDRVVRLHHLRVLLNLVHRSLDDPLQRRGGALLARLHGGHHHVRALALLDFAKVVHLVRRLRVHDDRRRVPNFGAQRAELSHRRRKRGFGQEQTSLDPSANLLVQAPSHVRAPDLERLAHEVHLEVLHLPQQREDAAVAHPLAEGRELALHPGPNVDDARG